VKLGHERWALGNTPIISKTPRGRGRPKSQSIHVCGVDSAFGRDTSEKSWKALMLVRVRVSKEATCMALEYLGHPQNRWPQRFGSRVGTQVAILLVFAL